MSGLTAVVAGLSKSQHKLSAQILKKTYRIAFVWAFASLVVGAAACNDVSTDPSVMKQMFENRFICHECFRPV